MFTRSHRRTLAATFCLGFVLLAGVASAQSPTPVVPPKNKYKPADDVRLGREAVQEILKQTPLLKDAALHGYLEQLGQRLVAVIPATLQQKEFVYTFDVADMDDLNAFALPGGPMFVHRGIMKASKNEGELIGVMAHELSHVILRHGTAQQTKAEKFQLGALAGQVIGTVVGGAAGSIIAQGSSFGVNTYFMKFSRDHEKQADILGAQLMAKAGYDPRDMAAMFRTLEKEGGPSGPQWLSSHPNPGNRAVYITAEAKALKVAEGLRPDAARFAAMQTRIAALPPAAGARKAANAPAATTSPRAAATIEPPSTQFRAYRAPSGLQISVPVNWQPPAGGSSLMFAPQGAFYQQGNSTGFTHGVEAGVSSSQSTDLQRDTQALLQGLMQSNPKLRLSGGYQATTVGGRQGLAATLANLSEVTGQAEYIVVFTTRLRDGSLFYLIGVAPEAQASQYVDTFAKVRTLLRLND